MSDMFNLLDLEKLKNAVIVSSNQWLKYVRQFETNDINFFLEVL